MKYASRLLLIILFSNIVFFSFGQNIISSINGYKYVYIVPITYPDGTNDKFSIVDYASKKFTEIGFQIIDVNRLSVAEKNNTQCETLICYIKHTGNTYGKNILKMVLKNCKNESVYETEEHANVATWVGEVTVGKDLAKCIKKAMQPLEKLNYKYDSKLTPEINSNVQIEKTGETEVSLKKYYSENAIDEIEGIYKSVPNIQQPNYRIGIKKYGDYNTPPFRYQKASLLS